MPQMCCTPSTEAEGGEGWGATDVLHPPQKVIKSVMMCHLLSSTVMSVMMCHPLPSPPTPL